METKKIQGERERDWHYFQVLSKYYPKNMQPRILTPKNYPKNTEQRAVNINNKPLFLAFIPNVVWRWQDQ